jgi:hypothetical protein
MRTRLLPFMKSKRRSSLGIWKMLVRAYGARSTLRSAIGCTFDRFTYDKMFIAADVYYPFRVYRFRPARLRVIMSLAGPASTTTTSKDIAPSFGKRSQDLDDQILLICEANEECEVWAGAANCRSSDPSLQAHLICLSNNTSILRSICLLNFTDTGNRPVSHDILVTPHLNNDDSKNRLK